MRLITDISTYGAMLFAAVALVVSTAALRIAVRKPNLKLEVDTGTKRYTQKPELKVQVDTSKRLSRGPNTRSWRMLLTNVGNASARYPIVQVEFLNTRLSGQVPGWDSIHLSGLCHTVLRWTYPGNADTVIHPNFPYEIPPLDLDGLRVEADDDVLPDQINVRITLAADGYYSDSTVWVVRLAPSPAES